MRINGSATFLAALRAGEALLLGCALVSLGGCVKTGALTAPALIDVPARDSTRAGSTVARDVIGEVRVGHGLDREGKVPPGFGASRFAVGDPIQLSLWTKTEAQAGSAVRVSVRDATDHVVWSESRLAPRGESYLSFGIGEGLISGKYRAEVIVAHEITNRTGFEVINRRDR